MTQHSRFRRLSRKCRLLTKKLDRNRYNIIAVLFLLVYFSTFLVPARAETNKKTNDATMFFQPFVDFLTTPTPIQSPLGKQTVVPEPVTAADIDRWERLKHAIRNISQYYHINPKLGIAQAALESARGTSEYCIQRNNCFGIAAYTDNPDAAWYFNSIEEGVIEYYRLQRNNFPEAWAAKDDPAQMLQLLENNSDGLMYATDPDYVYLIESMPEWNE